MAGASDAFTAGQYVNSVETFVSNGSLKVGLKNATTAGNAWTIMDNFYLEYLGKCVMDYAKALPEGGDMTADTWYYFDIETAGGYIMTATTLGDIVFTTDGYEQIDGASTVLSSPSTLSITRYYVKSSSANNLTYVIDTYDLTEEIAAYNTAVANANTAKTNAEATKVNATDKTALDNAIATYTGEGEKAVDVNGTQNSAMKAALEEATPALVSATNAVNASLEAYAKAASAIADAEALQTNHNFVTTAAATTFAQAIDAIKTPYNNGTLDNDAATNSGTTLGVVAVDWHEQRAEANRTAAEAYMKSLDFGMTYNDWSIEGEEDGSNFVIPFFEYWTSAANSLAAATKTATLTDLPNGLYSIQAWVRVRAKNGTAATDATGITMDVNGGGEGDYAAVDVTEGTQVGESQFRIGTYTAQGLVKQGSLTLNFNIADANISWLSIKNIKYTKVRDLTEEEAFVAATAEDYAALNAAIAAHTLGFEADEYAPYNNVAGIAAVAAAQAINQEAENDQGDVQAATAAIISATWTANEVEMNAIYDGTFAAAGNDGAPAGWVTTHNSGLGGAYHARAFVLTSGMNNYDNLEAFGQGDTRSAFYIRFDGTNSAQGTWYNYGGTNGYTMPLKANTKYKLTLQAGAWGDYANKKLAVTIKDAIGENVLSENITTTKKTSNGQGVDDGSFTFTTNDAGNYTLSFWNGNGSNNYAAIVSNIVIVKATAADFKEALLAEITTANAVDVTANVGNGVFQKPTTAVTALTTAISDAQAVYDNADATVDQVLNATESVKTAVETYNNAKLNAPDAAKRYAVTMHDAGKDWDGNAITFIAGGREGEGDYNVKYEAPANVNLAQALKFTSVEEKPNTFYISVVNANGTEQYLTSKTLAYGNGTVNDQIRTTDDATKAVEITVKVANDVEGFKLFNQTGKEIARNSSNPDNGLFPDGNVGSYFTIAETQKPSITINTTDAKWGTTILPFAVASLPEGVKAYTCAEVKENGTDLNLVYVDALEANKPYIIEGVWSETLIGDAQGTALTYTEGLLTGVYAAQDAPVDSYVLQKNKKNNNKVGFYKVKDGEQPTVGANRCYLTVPSSARAFFLFDNETGISAIEALTSGEAQIFDINGVQQPGLQKGMNIIRKADGQSYKVMVK